MNGGESLGYLLGFRPLTFYANGPVGWVEEITVRHQDRSQGIGRTRMNAFEHWAAGQGCAPVALATRRAAPFYHALGYEESATYFRKVLADQLRSEAGLSHPARQLIVTNAILTGQVRQLQTTVGIVLMRTRPDGGSRRPPTASSSPATSAPPWIIHAVPWLEGKDDKITERYPGRHRDRSLTRQTGRRDLFNYSETPSSRCSGSRDPYTPSGRTETPGLPDGAARDA